MANIHPCLLEYLDSLSKHDSANNLIMQYVGTGTTSYEETIDISKIPNFVDALTSGDLTLTLIRNNRYIRESLINYSTFIKTGSENRGSFYKNVPFDEIMMVKISCDNVYADNATLLIKCLPVE